METKNPLVSIIIPLYNAERYISAAIISALNQTWEIIEILIINDGSTDNSLAIAKTFENENITVYHQKNKGASAARNFGLREAKGDYIQFLDADDLLSPDKIEKQISIINNDQSIISFCENINFKDDIKSGNPIEVQVKKFTDPFELLLNLYGGFGNPSMIAIHSWLVPSKVIAKAGFWNEKLSMDDDGEYFCRVVLASKKVLFCAEGKSYYRKFIKDSLSSQKSLKHYESELLSTKLKSSYMLSVSEAPEVKRAMAFWFMRLAIICYPKFKIVSDDALLNVKSLGVKPEIHLMGGKLIEIIRKNLGWKTARIIQSMSHKA